jgi:hypothetical protein
MLSPGHGGKVIHELLPSPSSLGQTISSLAAML